MDSNQTYNYNYDYDLEWLRMCVDLAEFSLDKSTKNGAILVKNEHMIGYSNNRFVSNIEHNPLTDHKDKKLDYTVHAEEGCIFSAIKKGNFDLIAGSTLYCPFACCTQCARAIIEFKVSRVVTCKTLYTKTSDRWRDSIDTAFRMLYCNKIKFDFVDKLLNKSMFFRGQMIKI